MGWLSCDGGQLESVEKEVFVWLTRGGRWAFLGTASSKDNLLGVADSPLEVRVASRLDLVVCSSDKVLDLLLMFNQIWVDVFNI